MARTPRLSGRFLAQRKALGIEGQSAASRAISVKIAGLCAVEGLPEADHSTRIGPDPSDDRGVDLLTDVVAVTVVDGGARRRFWLCYRVAGDFLRIEAIYDGPPPWEHELG